MVLVEIALGILRESTWGKIHGKNRQGPSTKWDIGEAMGKPTGLLSPCLFFRALFLSGVGGRVALGGTRIPLNSH